MADELPRKDELTRKDKLDGEMELMKLAWSSFDRRRDFEWKVALGLWTALAAFVALILTGDVDHQWWVPIGAIAGAAALFLLHWRVWSRGMGLANRADRHLQYFYEDRIKAELGVVWTDDITDELAGLSDNMGRLNNWSHIFQYGVTGILCLAVAGSVLSGYYADESDAATSTRDSTSATPTATATATP